HLAVDPPSLAGRPKCLLETEARVESDRACDVVGIAVDRRSATRDWRGLTDDAHPSRDRTLACPSRQMRCGRTRLAGGCSAGAPVLHTRRHVSPLTSYIDTVAAFCASSSRAAYARTTPDAPSGASSAARIASACAP